MLGRLTAYVAPFVLRRTKEEVAPDLPDKIVDIVRVDLGKEHRHIYDQYLARERARILDLLRDVDANRMSVLASITRLRQLALDPALVEESYAHVGSAKIEYAAEYPSCSSMGRRVVALRSLKSSARAMPKYSSSR